MAEQRRVNKQKLYVLRAHDTNVAKDDVIFNTSYFPELGAKAGDLIQVVAIKENASSTSEKNPGSIRESSRLDSSDSRRTWNGRHDASSMPVTIDETGRPTNVVKEPDRNRCYVFIAQDPQRYGKKNQDIALSISSNVASIFGFKNRMQVLVSIADEAAHAASHVEIVFRDQYLSRADMWRLAIAELSQKTIYKDQKLSFLDTIKATVKTIYRDGEKKKAGFFSSDTKTIFRSESARYIIFIQMSLEMWQFDVEGGGEIMFNKVINGYLPELFKNWASIRAKHRISFVLFSRVEYDDTDPRNMPDLDDEFGFRAGTRDFYRVVVSDVSSGDWITILHQLKQEFRTFLRDITVQQTDGVENRSKRTSISSDIEPEYVIVGKPSIASRGNILEAINLALTQFSGDYIDRDLLRTGISVMVITAGSGVYEVDYTLLRHTTETLIGSGIGIDLVCLAPMPLHSVPLFKYRNPRLLGGASLSHHTNSSSMENTPRQHDIKFAMESRTHARLEATISAVSETESDLLTGDWSYAIPHWVDVSFWKGTTDELALVLQNSSGKLRKTRDKRQDFELRCVLYELEMMGFMENEMTNIAIALMHEHPLHPWQKLRHRITGRAPTQIDRPGIQLIDHEWMNDYDDAVFMPTNRDYISEVTAKRMFKAGLADRGSIAMRSSESINGSHTGTARGKSRTYSGLVEPKLLGSGGLPHRAPSIMSMTSNADRTSIASKSSMLTRQISYGTPTLAAPQETKVDGVAEASLAKFMPANRERKTLPSAPNYFETFRAMFAKSTAKTKAGKHSSEDVIPEESGEINEIDEVAKKQEGTGRTSKPIDIDRTSTQRILHHSRTSSTEEKIGSIDTVKAKALSPSKFSASQSVKIEDGGAILYVASNTRRSGKQMGLSSSGEEYKIPQTLSPLRGIAPWLLLVNPSNPHKNPSSLDNRFRRWHHIFPKPLKVSVIKWKSLSSPASVPLTNDYFPTRKQLADEYQERVYSIVKNTDDDILDESNGKDIHNKALIRELIAFRLAKGFQLIVGSAVSEFLGTPGTEYEDIFSPEYMIEDGATVFMSMGNIIHQLLCLSRNEVEVRRFHRKPITDVEPTDGPDSLEYKPYIRPALAATYQPREIKFSKETTEYNWNFIDSFLAGYKDEFSEDLRFWRARFVFIPVDVTGSSRRTLPTLTEDSEEEIRLEGIRKLTTIWQRHRVYNADERGFQSSRRRQDRNPLMIDYQTRDPSAVISAGAEGALLADGETSGFIFSETEKYSTDSIDLQKLAADLSGEKGIPMMDRRWHWKTYHDSFTGFDLVSWLLDRFRDIETREDAVELGKELQVKGLFQHVSKKHDFRDGNFFFHLSSEYRLNKGDIKSWFASKRGLTSIPSTPAPDTARTNFATDSLRSRPDTSSSSGTLSLDESTSSWSEHKRRKVILSHVMRYNVDPRKQSYRPEIINLHYDRLHSPDNCFHFRIDWMNVTAKFIEDAVNQWAAHGRRFGLKLVEVPIQEASTISDRHPFRGPVIVKLALAPPNSSPHEPHEIVSGHAKDIPPDRFAAHKAILKRLNFVLDVESAASFPADVDVVYSWGRNDYKLTQYLHRSGTTIAQITESGEFLLLANRLFNNRSFVVRDAHKFERKDDMYEHRGGTNRAGPSPTSSPAIRPVPEHNIEAERKTITAEEVKDEVEAFCSSDKTLRAFYDELRKAIPSPSPAMSSTSLDTPVPSLRLPPRVGNTRDLISSPLTTASNQS